MAWATTKEGFPIDESFFYGLFGGDVPKFVEFLNGFLAEAYKDASPDTSPDTSPERPSEWPELDASNFTLGVTDISHLIDPLTKLPVTRETIEGMGDLTAQLGYGRKILITVDFVRI